MNLLALIVLLAAANPPDVRQAADAVAVVAIDLGNLPPEDRPFIRYVWNVRGDPLDVKAAAFAHNWAGSGLPYLPVTLANGRILRIDLRLVTRNSTDLKRWLTVWEELQYDPSFHTLFTYQMLKFYLESGGVKPTWLTRLDHDYRMAVVPGKTANGERWTSVVNIPRFGLAWEGMAAETNSVAPIVELDYLVNRMLGSLRGNPATPENAVYNKVFGGLYYRFAGIRTVQEAGKKKATDFDVLLQDLGILDDADVGGFQAKLDRLGSEQRIGINHSQVTGKSRVVSILPTLRSVRERSVVFITHDPFDESVDINDDPAMNLLDFQGDAFEVIFVDSNGSQKYALFNRAGALQFEVPPNIANDSTVPRPHTQRLHTISCITCHGAKGLNGWQPLPNDAAALLPSLLADRKRGFDGNRLIKEKFTGNADLLLMELRRGTMAAALRMTGTWPGEDQTEVYGLVAARISVIRNRYWYEPIDAARMLAELGYDVPEGQKAKDYLAVRVSMAPVFLLEDVRVKKLILGQSLTRSQADLVKSFIAERMEQTK